MRLSSYACGEWFDGAGTTAEMHHAVSGATLASLSSAGLDVAGMLDYGRRVGGPELRALTFHERALRLKALAAYLNERKEDYYRLSFATGATRKDAWIDIDGGIGTLFVYSGKGRREMPNDSVFLDGQPEAISRGGTFTAQHICVPLEGVAILINAFNFPCWGMLEKLAPALLAGMPCIVKPATATAYLAERMFRDMIAAQILPAGALQLICGSVGKMFRQLTCQDVVSFTGSAATGLKLSQHPTVVKNATRFTMEADSLNCSILGPDAGPGTPEFDLYVREVVREMTVKAGQKCTAIRRVIVPRPHSAALVEALQKKLQQVVVGNPEDDTVRMGALAGQAQRDEVLDRVAVLERAGERVFGDPDAFDVIGADKSRGAFLPPMLLYCDRPFDAGEPHNVEAFGPVSTVMPYDTVADAVELARRGRGSLVGSVFTHDMAVGRELVLGTAPYHGRLVVIDRTCANESTGHGSPLPHLVHGGPGRAGGGEEMGGIRGVLHYMQRTAVQGSPTQLSAITGRWISGAQTQSDDMHPFRKSFEALRIGDTLTTKTREVTLDDVERFAALTGDTFYAHMDDAAARANPFFDGRVAHGYFVVSAAAGLFVDPAPGPVLANYGLDGLRFTTPVYPGDRLTVHFTCKQKTDRIGEQYGEVRWDVNVVNQDGATAAAYDILTLVAHGDAAA